MNCEQARNLFDAHLNGELSSALETELAAHRVSCSECRHELALLEVAGHVISTGRDDGPELAPGFTDRLLACVETPRKRTIPMPSRFDRRWMVGGGVLAAAASVMFAFNIWLADPGARIAGMKVTKKAAVEDADIEVATDSMVRQVEKNLKTNADGAQLLMQMGQMSMQQLLDRLQPGESGGKVLGVSDEKPTELKVSSDLEIEDL